MPKRLLKKPGIELELTEEQVTMMEAHLLDALDMLPTHISRLLISEYAERRILPPGTPRPGKWDNSHTPYLVETMDNMSPSSPVQREIILKAAQGGWTALAEIVLCYYMDEAPSDILFMSAGDDILERWATRRLEPAIDSFGFRDKMVVDMDLNSKSRRTGDKMLSKDFYGGRLDMASARSAAKMRATDKRVLIRDEIDGVPAMLTTGEGYWLDVSYARTKAWGARRKVMDFGTPTTYSQSEIWKAYLLGDQRKFFVPCPFCGAFQVLDFNIDNDDKGIVPVTVGGKLKEAVYVCEHCREAISNSHKKEMLNQGYWEATTQSTEKNWVSRHWNSCYSPFMSFTEMYREYERAKEKPGGMRSFTNLNLGLPYKETGTRLSKSRLISLRSSYSSGTVPEGVIFTTGGADVQRGKTGDPSNPPRIEIEICGHGEGYRTWSIQYFRIEGEVDNAYSGAWEELYQKVVNGEFVFKRRDGVEFTPKRIFIDSGFMTHVVYQFVGRLSNVFAVKGEGNDFTPDQTRDKRTKSSDRRYKISKTVTDSRLYLIATNEYKRILRSALKVKMPSDEGGEIPKMACQFPSDYDDHYFDMLNAEEMLVDGSFESYGRRNEATDCRVYNMCAAESFINEYLRSVRENYRKQGYSDYSVQALTPKVILKKLSEANKPGR